MKKNYFLIVLCLFAMQLNAQVAQRKATVAVGDFTGNYSSEMHNACIASMPRCRVNVVDWNSVRNNSNEAKNVDFIITCTLGNLSMERKQGTRFLTKETYYYYDGKITFNLVLKDARTGKIMATRNSFTSSSNEDRQKCLEATLQMSSQECRRLVDNGIVVSVPIKVVQDVKKDKVQTVVIDGGSNIGICPGLYFNVQMESEIAGSKIYKTVGTAKVKEVLSGELTLCEITKGNKEIMKLLNDDVKLFFTSTEEPMIHF